MRSKIFALIIAAVSLLGCATVQYLPDKGQLASRQVRDSNYTIGAEQTVVVGNPIVRVRDYQEITTETASIQASESFRLSGGIVSIDFTEGETLPIVGQRVNSGVTYTVAQKREFGIQVGPDGIPAPGVINGLGTDMQVVMMYHFVPSSSTARLNRIVDRRVQRIPSGQNFEIVFNGIDGQAMHFQYREYTGDDLARPAFFQELSYPLTTRIVRFRELVIGISSVDAQQVRYTVTADGRGS